MINPMYFKSILLSILSLIILSCSHTSVTKDLLTPDYLLEKGSKQLTFLGDNSHPRFSPDGQKILFSSSQRTAHKGTQIYELDFIKNKERRVTFSDGDAFDPVYVNSSELIYSSTTDEIKENPLMNKDFEKDTPPSDLYLSDLFGTEIVRLTAQPGFDGETLWVPSKLKPSALFTSYRGSLLGIYRLDPKSKMVSLISAEKGKAKRFPALAPDQKELAWVEKDLKTQEQSLILFKMKERIPRVLKANEGEYRDLFIPQNPPLRLFYSIIRKGEKFSQIESYDIEKQCTQVVFKGKESLAHPVISSGVTEKIAFTRYFQGKGQLYIAPLPTDLGPCLETSTQAILKE